MSKPTRVVLVRFKSALSFDEVMRIVEERAPQFRALPGLVQKYYLQDAASDEIAGLYLWESEAALDEYQKSKLRASIAEAYRAQEPPRVEVYEVVKMLRDEAS